MFSSFYPAGRYNLNFDVCAMFLAGILFIFYITRPRVFQEKRTRCFLLLLFVLFVSSLCEFCASVMFNSGSYSGSSALDAVLTISHTAQVLLPYLLAVYLLEVLGFSRRITRRRALLLALPELFLLVQIMATEIRSVARGAEPHVTQTGVTLYNIFFSAVIWFYIGICLVVLVRSRRALLRREYISILIVLVAFWCAMVPQLFDPYLKATEFLVSLCMLGIFITLENDADLYDGATGLRTRTAIWRESQEIFDQEISSFVVSIKLGNTGYLSMMLGIPAMKELDREVGIFLQQYADDAVHVYRLSDQSYAMVLFQDDRDRAKKIAEEILSRFQAQWCLFGTNVLVPAQVWISRIPDQIPDEKHLNVFLDTRYDPAVPANALHQFDMLKSEARRSEVELALQRALDAGTLTVYYQPIYDTKEGRIHSCEALLRMHDEKLGNVSPEEFIKVAEQTGLIAKIGESVFEKVCAFLEREHPEQYGLDFVEVNLSTIQCMDPTLPMRFQRIMQSHGVKPQQINLEITESAVIHDEKTMQALLSTLQKIGFSFALDDFGTGNANYTYVMKYPFRLIKIDKSFLWGAEKDDAARAILENMLELVRGLGREAVVEGVETKTQRDMLCREQVRYLQGYYYSKPIPEPDFLNYVKNFSQRGSSQETDGSSRES
jgi:EAL domain-containing protein (putative c-di-GMP-specific phosphodiesterase class I)/GGDEF domain-containing protein